MFYYYQVCLCFVFIECTGNCCLYFTDTLGIVVTMDNNNELLMNNSVYLLPPNMSTLTISCLAFGVDADPQISFSSFNLTASGFFIDDSQAENIAVQITDFRPNLNGFFICSSGVSGRQKRVFVASKSCCYIYLNTGCIQFEI